MRLILAVVTVLAVGVLGCTRDPHQNLVDVKKSDCVVCHLAAYNGAQNPVHVGVLPKNCAECHSSVAWQPAADSGRPSAESITVNALVPTYAGTSIVSLSPVTQTLPMTMDHTSSQIDPSIFADGCTSCHVNAGSGVFYPGKLHASLINLGLAAPTACSDCHQVQPTGFVGPTATNPARSPASGEMKHDAVLWQGGAPTTTAVVPAECGTCHLSPDKGAPAVWTSGARFHASIPAQPQSCVDCHANTRPSAVLTSTNSGIPAGLTFDHTAVVDDCVTCHTGVVAWKGGRYHPAGGTTPVTCLPCHAGERPTSTTGWTSTTYSSSPFDYGGNTFAIKHGDGQDCVGCHNGPGTGAWGSTQNWVGGHFAHGAGTVATTTCIACHMSQRPDVQPGTTAAAMASLLGFDHSLNGTGDCFGCHQATVIAGKYVAYTNPQTGALPGGDWKSGQAYPGSTLIGANDQFITITELTLVRTGVHNLVTAMTSIQATLYNEMLHVSTALPAALNAGPSGTPDNSKCWHCHTHTGTTVTAFTGGQYHGSLSSYSSSPGGTVVPFPQPTTLCTDCHTQMRPVGIVEGTGSDLVAMDHAAQFQSAVVIGGASAGGVGTIECAVCHHSPGDTWQDGILHANIATAVPADCTVCHYPLVADTARSDLTSGSSYAMHHASAQLTIQNCQLCHTGALARATTTPAVSGLWSGATLHPAVPAQPATCVECHAVSAPAANVSTQSTMTYAFAQGGTASNGGQWMNHGSITVAGKDCAVCHAADAKTSGSAWSKSDSFHGHVSGVTTCKECHGLGNGGGSVAGTNNNLPSGLTNSSMATSAASDPSTGVPAGTPDQIVHTDVNVTGHDCGFCHTQVGAASPPTGKEWAKALFHTSFNASNPLVMNGTTGRCSSCHLNVKPGSGFPGQDHGGFTSTSGSQDCAACHTWPGTGTPTSPNWLGASGGAPAYIIVGGFTIPSSGTTQAGISSLPHPGTSSACTVCHATAAGGKPATGYDHASTLINGKCAACHEAGSNLIGTVWNGVTSQSSGAGDTRPYTLSSVVATRGSGGGSFTVTYANHFYPVDCKQCHNPPTGVAHNTAGSSYTNAWTFPHSSSAMSNPSTCNMCHT